MTTFSIGSQNAASIQNVGGDMVVHDGIHGTANVHLIELRVQLAQIRDEIDRLALPPSVERSQARHSPRPRPKRPRPGLARTKSPARSDA